MDAKSDFLQVRVTPKQKAALKQMARRAGMDMSSFVLSRVLPPAGVRFRELVDGLRRGENRRFVLAELNDLLSGLASSAFADTVADVDTRGLSEFTASYLAAMVEQAANRKGVAPPAWTRHVEALERPYFATDLKDLRLWLLTSSPVAFKRRNIFVDSSVGDRI